jgi:hypothetical protein
LAARLAPVMMTSDTVGADGDPKRGFRTGQASHARFADGGEEKAMLDTQSSRRVRISGLTVPIALLVLAATAAIAALVWLVVLPQRAAATGQVPFHATISETYPPPAICATSPDTLLCITPTGSGQATHLGRTSESARIVEDESKQVSSGCNTETRTTTLTGANGDQITMIATGFACATSPTTVSARDVYIVTSGTGRFSGAKGTGADSVSIDRATLTATATYDGTLSAPGSLP